MKVQKEKQEQKEKQVQEDKQEEIRALSPTYSRTDSQTFLNTAS